MLDIIKKHKFTLGLVAIFIVLLSAYFIREYNASKEIYIESYLKDEEYIMIPKTYDVNEYSPVNITDEQMANIYLNDFKNTLYVDMGQAYILLNEEYRNLKFGSIENFINYINKINPKGMKIESYSINASKDIIKIYTIDENMYIFKINSVMEYEIYLDDYTVEI